MLFDLRGRGRRRSVQIIYIGLALLMGVGLVGFGIGGGFGGGGILNASSNGEGGGGTSYTSQIKKYKKLVSAQPKDVSAWEQLVKVQLLNASGEQYFSSTTGLSSKGKELFAEIAQSWSSYLALNPAKPNSELAERMLTIFSESALNEPSESVQALEIAVAARPTSAALYSELAEEAYKAKNVREGDLASEKAVSLVPASEQARVKRALESVKKNPNGSSEATSSSGSGEATSSVTTVSATSAGTSSTKTK
jgi:hypothetical protein